MKKIKCLLVMTLSIIILSSAATIAFASDTGADADYLIDQNNVIYVYQNGSYIAVENQNNSAGGGIQLLDYGFGESSASWMYSLTDNGYTVNHKGWKERESSSSLYGVRACSKTGCSPTKNHWTQARMTSLGGIITYTDSGQVWGTGTPKATSPYYGCHINNSIMRSTWGGVGTVIKQW